MNMLVDSISWLLYIVLPWKQGWTCHFKLWFSQDLSPGVALQDPMVPLCFIFLRNAYALFHPGLQPFPQEYRRIAFALHPLEHLFSVDLFDAGLNYLQCEVIFHCSFDLPWFNSEVEYLSHAFWSYTTWVQLTSWNWLLESRPIFKFFPDNLPEDITWGQVSLTAPRALWSFRSLQHRF